MTLFSWLLTGYANGVIGSGECLQFDVSFGQRLTISFSKHEYVNQWQYSLRLKLIILVVLRRIYPEELAKHNYGTTLSSLAFAGTIVGMVSAFWVILLVLTPSSLLAVVWVSE